MPETRPSSKAFPTRIRALEAKHKALHAMVLKLADLSDNVSRPEDRRLFMMKTITLQATQAEFARVTEALIAVRMEADPEYIPSYESIESFDELICKILFVKAEISAEATTRTIKSEKHTVRSRLPPIELLKFSGEATKWKSFAEIFIRVVGSNDELSDAERAHYLITHLTGPALSTVSGVLPTGENYDIMWQLLKEKYEDIRIIANSYLSKLLRFKPLASQDAKSLNRFSDEFVSTVVALKALDLPDLADFMFTHLALSKLDYTIVHNFERSLANETPNFNTLSAFVRKHHKILTRTDAMISHAPADDAAKSHKPRILVTSSSKARSRCSFCHGGSHVIYCCEKFAALSPPERLNAARKGNLCLNCLGNHSFSNCPSKKRCGKCNRAHHSLLHLTRTASPARERGEAHASTNVTQLALSVSDARALPSASIERDDRVYVSVSPTAEVFAHRSAVASQGRGTLRILLDSGANGNFVSREYCKQNRFKITYAPSSVFGLGDVKQAVLGYTYFSVTSRFDSRYTYRIRASVLDKLTDRLPVVSLNAEVRRSLAKMPLADERFYEQSEIHCILGAALVPRILRMRKVKLPSSNLYAMDSTLGYLIMGETTAFNKPERGACFFAGELDNDLNRRVQSFWALEAVPDRKHLSPEEKACELNFEKNVSRLEDGSFMVALPFKEEPSALGESRYAAERRLFSLEKRLDANPEIRAGYNATFSEYLDRGFVHKVSEAVEPPSAYYIPHRAVYRPDKDTSRIRLVLDASCKSSSGKSLNDVLHCGPNLQSHIFNLLVNFRLFKVALSADIAKMYFSIKVHPRHRCFLRVLYRFSEDDPVGVYEFSSLPMGLSSSCYLSVKVLQRLFREEDSPGLRELLESSTCTYMDDYLLSVQTPTEATSIRRQLTESHASAGFTLTKWFSNSDEFMNELASSPEGGSLVSLDSDNHVKLVGLWWDPTTDSFVFKAGAVDPAETCTKRHMLSVTASLYDPLGFLSPIVAGFKVLIQECWNRDLGWDQIVPDDIAAAWRELRAEMPSIAGLRIPRCLGLASGEKLTLLGFADASEKCLGAVIYARVGALGDQASSVTLLCSKSRLAPLKRVSLARLELCAAHLLATIVQAAANEIGARHAVENVFAFSDSTVALAWIRASPHRWQTFIANRTAAIQEIIPPGDWFHVAGDENPSDVITRPPLPSKLIVAKSWVSGPPWARLPSPQWPSSARAEEKIVENIPEARVVGLSTTAALEDHPLDNLVARVSCYDRLLNVLVFVLRFGKKLPSRGYITPSDREVAECCLLRRVQAVYFSADIRALEKGKTGGKKIRKLTPILKDGLLCVGGRLKHAELSLRQKHPVLLPHESRVSSVQYDLRFGKKLPSRGYITPSDREVAECCLLRRVQAVYFSADIRALEKGKTGGKKIRKLTPILKDGLLCVGGRLKHAELSLRQKHPVLLPHESRVSELIIRNVHIKNFHTGPGLLLALLRSKYWILSARRLVRKTVHSCNVCFKLRPVPRQPLMGNLPKLRLQEGKGFLNSGVDYAGPISVRMSGGRGGKTTKAYICVFVCLATKALHIELVSDLSTNLFLDAFKRFISRRGPVSCVLSDGGRNFIGAKRKLSEIFSLISSDEYNREIIRALTPLQTEFKINPPLAPHFGGLWEANVKSVKNHLFRVLGTQVLTYEELNTLLVQIEALLNSRPLCVLSTDPNEPVALTPAHFLTLQPLNYLPAQDLRDSSFGRLPRHALIDKMVQSYWDRWRKEYLCTLQSREKWNVPDQPLRIGQVVVLNEPNVPTLCWPLGIIEEIFPGSDGVTRVVKVKTRSGLYVRPATRVCVLPTQ